eukprot:NODE_384_length_8342_cov_0.411379.p6 type:complete len:102 gc:universal NODE_384_length_8342_cov_0.411379:5259-4954(-)
MHLTEYDTCRVQIFRNMSRKNYTDGERCYIAVMFAYKINPIILPSDREVSYKSAYRIFKEVKERGTLAKLPKIGLKKRTNLTERYVIKVLLVAGTFLENLK